MAGKAKYLMIASMDVDPEHEAIFNEVYDQEHVPNLSRVPGVVGITRYKRGTLTMNIGGGLSMRGGVRLISTALPMSFILPILGCSTSTGKP